MTTEAAQSSKDLSIATGPDDIRGLKHPLPAQSRGAGKKGETSPMLLTAPL